MYWIFNVYLCTVLDIGDTRKKLTTKFAHEHVPKCGMRQESKKERVVSDGMGSDRV